MNYGSFMTSTTLNLIPDEFDWLAQRLPTPPVDYWDFPSVMLACAESPRRARLYTHSDAYFRRLKGGALRLLSWTCPTSVLVMTLAELKTTSKIDSVYFVHKDFTGLKVAKSYNEFWVDTEFDDKFPHLAGKHSSDVRRKVRRGFEKYEIEWDAAPTQAEVIGLIYEWAREAKKRHWMVAVLPYVRFIERFYIDKHNAKLIAFRRKEDGILYGIAGYEMFGGCANILVMKHKFGDNVFTQFFWTATVKEIWCREKPIKIFCGGTADKLKRELGFKEAKAYKIVNN